MRHSETDKDTICALATAHGIGAISIIRISGAQAEKITRQLAEFLPEKPESHKIYYGFLKAARSDRPLDEVLISYFAEGRSFTGEPSFEISCHGSEVIVDDILRELIVAGARPAERGEFTYRAFMSGRIDLVQAESVLDLIESRSSRAAQLALRQLKGEFSNTLKGLLDRMTWILAHLEAGIDFASEDIVITAPRELAKKTEELLETVRQLLAGYRQGLIIRNGFQVAMVGRPNAGKSSLLNALAGEERAIVTPIAGTTRDFVEAQLSDDGLRITLIDTAGLRISDEPVEKIGVERTLAKIQEVDLVLYLLDAQDGASTEDREFFHAIPWNKTAVVINKVDLQVNLKVGDEFAEKALGVLPVSATTGAGLKELRQWLKARLKTEVSEDSTLLSNARQFKGLEDLRASLEATVPLMLQEESPDLIALELQIGMRALYEVLGMSFDDQVMDRVFAEFCLGK